MTVLRYVIATSLALIAAGVLLIGAITVCVGIYATWAYQDDPSSAQNLILVPFGLILAAPGWGIGYVAYRVARPNWADKGSRGQPGNETAVNNSAALPPAG